MKKVKIELELILSDHEAIDIDRYNKLYPLIHPRYQNRIFDMNIKSVEEAKTYDSNGDLQDI